MTPSEFAFRSNHILSGLIFRFYPRLLKNKIFLATKFGNKALPDGKRVICNDPQYIREEVENSLRRLKTDYIDLLYW